jgi:hypothetical protein
MRHIKFKSIAELERNYVRRYIQASIEQLGAAASTRGSGKSVVKGSGLRRTKRR